MKIPLQDFSRHVASFKDAVAARLHTVHTRANFILGPEVTEFEKRFAKYLGVPHVVGVANGTQAIELALRALDCCGGEVITVANAGMYATCAILNAKLHPVYCEIDSELMTMNPQALRKAITSRTRAIIATHLYGQAADMGSIATICNEAGIPLIEDCAESHGARWEGRMTGSFGIAGCFSFYPTKNLGAYGDAGAVVSHNDDFAQRLRSLRQYGWANKYYVNMPGGTNSRMDEMQAAVLNVKLDHLDSMNKRRRQIASIYHEALSSVVPRLPFSRNDNFIVHHYVLRSTKRKEVIQQLAHRGVASDVHFPVPDYQQRVLKEHFKNVHLSLTEECCRTVFTIPSFPEMEDDEVSFVAKALQEAYQP